MGAYLLDTHMFLWALADPSRLVAEARSAIEALASIVRLSTADHGPAAYDGVAVL